MAKKNKQNITKWIVKISILAFIISFSLSALSEALLPKINIIIGIIILLIFIFIGVLFDMIGVAFTSADEEPFHAQSSRKVHGASTAVKLIKNAPRVSSFCNDVVGDICGILSGSAGVVIAAGLISNMHLNSYITALTVTAIISSLTIGLKAIGKEIAIKNNTKIISAFSKTISIFYK
ncbi:MAG: hypothetical protein PHD02_00770 [Bacilli bacterium]|nr:hypothetical protein [Bacilli bacterium]